MKPIPGLLLLPLLVSCDIGYAVRRSTPVASTIDPVALDEWATRQSGYQPNDAQPWNGELAWHPFERDRARAIVCLWGGELEVYSTCIGGPTDDELDGWLRLHSELITALCQRFPFLPPATEWRTTTNIETQLAAAMERAWAATEQLEAP